MENCVNCKIVVRSKAVVLLLLSNPLSIVALIVCGGFVIGPCFVMQSKLSVLFGF